MLGRSGPSCHIIAMTGVKSSPRIGVTRTFLLISWRWSQQVNQGFPSPDYPLEDIAEAYQYPESGQKRGHIAIAVA